MNLTFIVQNLETALNNAIDNNRSHYQINQHLCPEFMTAVANDTVEDRKSITVENDGLLAYANSLAQQLIEQTEIANSYFSRTSTLIYVPDEPIVGMGTVKR